MSTYIEKQEALLRLQARKRRQKQRERNIRLLWMSIIMFSILLLVTVGAVAAGKIWEVRETELQQAAVKETETEQIVQTEKIRKPGPYPYHKPVEYSYTEALLQLETLAVDYPEFEEICRTFEKYPGDLMVALANNPDMLSFVEGYLTADQEANGILTAAEKAQKIPQLLQWDKRWGYMAYGDDNIALSGCAPTCLSMVIIGLTGKTEMTPDVVGTYAMDHSYYVYGTGTNWEIMTAGSLDFGIQGEIIQPTEAAVAEALQAGKPVICSMGPGDFTYGGHFIVLTGMEDGQIRINDPNSKVRSEKLWDFGTIQDQIKGLWAFTKI